MKTSRPAVAALALSLLLAARGLAATGLKGSVVVSGAIPAQKKVDVTIDQFVCGIEKDPGDLIVSARKELKNAVVWIDNPPAGSPAVAASDSGKRASVDMDQKECVFIPRIVIIPAGHTVFFLNSDRLLHNIHATPSHNLEFNRTQPKNRTIPVTFTKPEIVHITCDLHPWMTGWVVVAAHPYYAVTGTDGRFAFDDVPPGQYKLKVWHERLGTAEATATVGDQPKHVTIELKAR